ncbi:uncharacterized protein LOC9640968 [Selaginella moellendorffii]|uniref:uncharacterized protein LOC9640968 n=1 Tax=Selaginella moellendorffii TaxID=88036 RepID=UPI000D1C7938|nr:uncharacterized protein LOC9640968 [Selaginella moellendorffii]|eukprot:XP_024522880.1 uncharacterized protein LOC9640968 [Selaginella moellendorffii]
MAREKKKRSKLRHSDDEEEARRSKSKHRKRGRHCDPSSDEDASSSGYSSSSEDERRRRKRKERKKEKKRKERKRKDNLESKSRSLEVNGGDEELVAPEIVANEILLEFPALSGELKQLLHMVDSGQGVDVSGIPDEKLRELLFKLFQALKLSKVDRVYLLPEGSNPTLSTLAEVLKGVPDAAPKEEEEAIERKESHGIGPAERPPAPRVIGPTMPTPDMLAAAARVTEAEDALRKAEEELDQDPFVGPPPPAIVAEAESVNEAERFEEVTRILDPDMRDAYHILSVKPDATAEVIKKRYWKLSLLVHPDKCAHPHAQDAFTTINKAFQELQDPVKRAAIDHTISERKRKEEEEVELRSLREAAQWRRMRGEIALAGDDELLGTAPKAPSRDEWMTVLPPERQAGPPSMHSTFFSKTEKTGRGDTSVWTDTPLEKAQKAKMQYLEAYNQAALPAAATDAATAAESQRSSEIAKVVDKYNEKKRAESLVEKHKREASEKKNAGNKKSQPVEDWVGKHPWKPWDRENDLAAGRKSVKLDAKSMAQGLSSRFGSSGAGERKFL